MPNYDILIIGTGAGGGTLAHALAPTGKKILIIDRGDYIPREKANWDPRALFVEARYKTTEKWYDKKGKPLDLTCITVWVVIPRSMVLHCFVSRERFSRA